MAHTKKCEPRAAETPDGLQELGHRLSMVYVVGDSLGRFDDILRKIAASERVARQEATSRGLG